LVITGATIVVHPGAYREPTIVVDKSVTIVGDRFPVLDGEGQRQIMTVVADDVTVRGLRFRDVGTTFTEDRSAIRISDVRGCVVENNRVDNGFFGIYLARVSHCRIAGNVLRGDVALADWEALPGTGALLMDVREPAEYAAGHIDGAINLPLPQLRNRLKELPRDREIWVYCGVGQRSYYALRVLSQHGFTVRNLPGGFTTYKQFQPRLKASTGAVAS
jgi:parallel beta-helix repeat protein